MASIQQVTVPLAAPPGGSSTLQLQIYDRSQGSVGDPWGTWKVYTGNFSSWTNVGGGYYARYHNLSNVSAANPDGLWLEVAAFRYVNVPTENSAVFGPSPMASSANLEVTFDAWGSPIPWMMGHVRLTGKVTFAQGLEVGTSAAALSFIDIEVSFGYPLDPNEWQWIECVGIWATGNKIFGGSNDLGGLSFTFYEGKEDSPVAPEVLADKGAARATGMRGMRRIVFKQFPIGVVGGGLPTFSAEFAMTKGAPAPLISVADVIKKVHARGGVTLTTESNFDDQADGVVFMTDLAPVSLARDLMNPYNFYIRDGDGANLSRRAVGADLVIDGDPIEVSDLIVESDNDPPITFEGAEQSEVPSIISMQYTDVALAFTNGVQTAKRPIFPLREVLSDMRSNVPSAFSTDAGTILKLDYDLLYRGWTEARKLKFKSSDIRIEVGDVKQINGHELGDFIVRVKKSNLRFDKAVVNEIESAVLLKRSGVDVNADSGDYISDTIIRPLNYPDIILKGSSSSFPFMGQPIIASGALTTSAHILVGGYGTAFASTSIPTRIPRSAFTPFDAASQDGVISAGPRVQDASFVYSIDFGRSGIQRISKANIKETQYLDLTGSTAALSPNGNQFAISDGFMYWSDRPSGAGGTKLHVYRLDLSLFSVAGLTSLALDADTSTFNAIGAVVNGDTLLLTVFDRSASDARLYSIDLTDPSFATFDYVPLNDEPDAGQGFLGRGLSVGGIAYFLPLEASDVSNSWDDENANKDPQVWGAKIDPSTITVGPVDQTFDTGATLENTTLSGGDLVADHDNTTLGGARNIKFKTSGKFYFEMTLDVVTAGVSGVCMLPSDKDYTNTHEGLAMYAPTGVIWASAGFSGSTLGTIASGDVIGCAVDTDAGLGWFRVAPSGDWNGSPTANPATGAEGINMNGITLASRAPALVFGDTGSDGTEKGTANFGATSFTGTVPSGFTSGWPGDDITGGIDWFDITDDANVSYGSKGNVFPWTDGTNLYFLANVNHQVDREQFLAARKLSDLSVVPGFDLSTLYDTSKFDFYHGTSDGSSHYIIGTNFIDAAGAVIKVEQDLSAGVLFYRGVHISPANDDFADAAPLSLNTTVTWDNLLATKQAGEPAHDGNSGGASIWGLWTAETNDPVTIDATATTSGFFHIAVYTGTAVDALTPVVSGNNFVPVSWTPTAGVRYHIAIDGDFGATGTIKFTFSG